MPSLADKLHVGGEGILKLTAWGTYEHVMSK